MVEVSQAELVKGAIAGSVVSFPTDTLPALASKPEVAEGIFRLKQRPKHKPLILMGASITDLLAYVTYTPQELEIWQKLIDRYLPGALTLVLPASNKVPSAVSPTQLKTVGIRIPAHSIACAILQDTGVLATTSANVSGQSALTKMKDINQEFPSVLVLNDSDWADNSKVGTGYHSTVIRWQNQKWEILRQGIITIESLS